MVKTYPEMQKANRPIDKYAKYRKCWFSISLAALGLSKEESGAFQLDHVANYINTIRPNLSLAESAGSVSRGYLLLDHRWQENMGDIKLADSLRCFRARHSFSMIIESVTSL